MSMTLQHDPKTKQQIKSVLYDLLYEPVLKSFRERLKNIIVKNAVLQKGSHPSFIYRGEIYVSEDAVTPRPLQVTPLAPVMRPEMEDYLKELAYLNNYELPYVLGYLNQVLNASEDLLDYLRLLPDSTHQPIQKLIASCGCRTTALDEIQVKELKELNELPIGLMKQRLMLNLLL